MTTTDAPLVAHQIKPRRVQFDWTDTPLHWVPGDAQTSHTMDVLHLLLPAGEKWFCEVYRQVLDEITDEQLRADVKGFIGQEAVHSRAHARVLDHLKDNGLDPTPYTKRIEFCFERLLGDRPLGLPGSQLMQRWWLIERLAIIAAIEHFTAVLGMWIIDSPRLDELGADPTMLDLLRWHGAEEVEHRSVAFDLFQHLSGSHIRRVIGMMRTIVVMTVLWIIGTRFFMKHDPLKPGRAKWWRLIWAGYDRRLPTVWMVLRAVPPYLRKDYHPSSEGSTDDALAYLATSPAAIAAATARPDRDSTTARTAVSGARSASGSSDGGARSPRG